MAHNTDISSYVKPPARGRGKTKTKMKYLRPRLPEKEIELCLDLFDKQEAKKRILKYIEGVFDDAESQFKNCFIHDVSNSSEYTRGYKDGWLDSVKILKNLDNLCKTTCQRGH